MKLKGPFLTLVTGGVLAAVLLMLSMTAAAKDSDSNAAGTPSPPAASPSASALPSPDASQAPVVTQAAYAGQVTRGAGTTLAIAVKDGKAVAYLCDGRRIEAWLQGTATDGNLNLTGAASASLIGRYGSSAVGAVSAGGRQWTFSVPIVTAPSGLYRSVANVRNAQVVGGWIVLPGGRQVGIVTKEGRPSTATRLNTESLTATVDGTQITAAPQDGSGF